uniref:G-protein coupled receptors family 1 profile domain-containing protein n=1 Tax=Capitella teleta TaxID=283909 RepID=X2B5V4_CAPTE
MAVRVLAMVLVMGAAVFGNLLVIISVFRFERLRIIANSFIVSLAFADLTVALLVMPFNASQEIAGRWMFGSITCDIFNANDVLFSTASLLHLCCISMDRYIAITDPFHYESKMTKRRVAIMLSCVWGASSLISHVPIHLGLYTTSEHRESTDDSDQCLFVVNKIYGAISSAISFWTPTIVMVFTYKKIYTEARKQEKQIYALTKAAGSSVDNLHRTNGANGARNGSSQVDNARLTQERKKMKREHKAAKTLGIIMGAFLLCWLPFFMWYVTTTMCGDYCQTPPVVVSLLFWVGYFNSALNPLIYAFFNRDFRNAFKRLLCCKRTVC